MERTTYSVGIDLAAATFVATVLESPETVKLAHKDFDNTAAGMAEMVTWLEAGGVGKDNTKICMEATGVYGEALAYFLAAAGWWVAVHAPLDVKRAFYPTGHKNDPVDSRQIAEYVLRFEDRLRRFEPKKPVLEQVQALLATREQFVRQKTANLNAIKALKRKVIRTPMAEDLFQKNVQQLSAQITQLEQEIERLFRQDPDLHQSLLLLLTVPGVGLLLASHCLITFEKLDQPYNPKVWAAYLGIAPLQKRSGTSVFKPDSSRHFGPSTMRKLLHLGARSVRTHKPVFRHYFERKVAEGKPKKLVLNNIANDLVRIICAVLRSQTPYIPNYRSVHPAVSVSS